MKTPVKLLYLEDDEADRRAFLHLVEDKGLPYAVTSVETLAEARARLAEAQFDVIVADYHLPDGNGTALFEAAADTPFILLSGTLEEHVALRALEHGADDYLAKDPHQRHLEAVPLAVEKALHRRHLRDVEQRLTRELREREEELRTITDNTPALIAYIDDDLRFRFINRQCEEWFGRPRAEILGRTVSEVLGAATAAQRRPYMERALAGEPVQFEGELPFRDGTPRWVVTQYVPHLGTEGRAHGLYVLSVDVTMRKKNEEGMRKQEEFIRRVLDSTEESIEVLDLDGHRRSMSKGGQCVFEISDLTPYLGAPWLDLWTGADREAAAQALAAARAGQTGSFHGFCPTATGRPKWWDIIVSPILDAHGQPELLLAVARDITGRKQAEAALHESQERIRALLDSAAEGFVGLNTAGHCTFVNRAALKLLGYERPEEVLGQLVHPLVHHHYPDGRPYPAEDCRVIQGMRQDSGCHVEGEVFWRKDGSSFPVEYWSLPLRQDGVITGIVLTFLDVTERQAAAEAVRQAQRRLTLALEAARMGSFEWNLRTNEIIWSANFHALLGYRPGEVAPSWEAWRARVVAEDAPGLAACVERVRDGLDEFHAEYRVRWPDGSVRRHEVLGRIYLGPRGETEQMLGIAQDVTERKQAEEALAQERNLLRTLIDHLPVPIYVKDTESRFLAANEAIALVMGAASPDALLGRADADFYPAEQAATYRADEEVIFRTGQPLINKEEPHRAADGSPRDILTTKVPLKDAQGRVVGLVGISHDITEQRKADAQLRLQAVALESVANGIVITDARGTIQWVNPAMTQLTGYSAAEVIGKTPRVFKSGQHDRAFYEQMWATILSGRPWHGELVNQRKDGRLYDEELTITPVQTSGGQITHFVAIKQDITERKAAEENLRRLNAELEKRVVTPAL